MTNLIQRITKALASSYSVARSYLDQELNQLVAAFNALRDNMVTLDSTVTANRAVLDAHIADSQMHAKVGLRDGVKMEPGATATTLYIWVRGALSMDDDTLVITADMMGIPARRSLSISSTGAGGLQSAASVREWYAAYLIYNPTTDTLSAFGSSAGNWPSPTLPIGYTKKALVGWFRINDSTEIEPFAHEPRSGLFRLFTDDSTPDTYYHPTSISTTGSWQLVSVPCRKLGYLMHIIASLELSTQMDVCVKPKWSGVGNGVYNQVADGSTNGKLFFRDVLIPVEWHAVSSTYQFYSYQTAGTLDYYMTGFYFEV